MLGSEAVKPLAISTQGLEAQITQIAAESSNINRFFKFACEGGDPKEQRTLLLRGDPVPGVCKGMLVQASMMSR